MSTYKKWICIEERTAIFNHHYTKLQRKIIFDDIFIDRQSCIAKIPISYRTMNMLKTGDIVFYLENSEIKQASYLCSSLRSRLSPREIVSELLGSENELRIYCKQYGIYKSGERANGYALAIDVHRHIVKTLGTHECLWKLSHDRALALRIDSRNSTINCNEPSTSREIKEENSAEDDGISDISEASQTESEMNERKNVPISLGILPIEIAGEYEGPTAGLEFTSRPSISLAPIVEMPTTSKNIRPDKSKQRNVLSLQQKIKIIHQHEKEGMSYRKLAAEYGVSAPAVFYLIKNKEQIMSDFARGCPPDRKIRRQEHFDALDDKCAEWIRAQPFPEHVPKVAIQEVARKFAKELGHKNFKASYDWLSRFSERKNMNLSRSSFR